MTKADLLLEFANLHQATCGGNAVDVQTDGPTILQSCTCGAEQTVSLSPDDADALLVSIRDDSAFAGMWRKAARRVVQ
jgi:hypothetical protein